MPNNKMLIDASHEEETRVVVLKEGRVEEFDFEAAARKLLKGSIYLAKVTRVEPSLQAAFVDFGGNRHGFLAFNEIHPDYYQIPFADRQALLEEQAARRAREDDDDIEAADDEPSDTGDDLSAYGGADDDDELGADDASEASIGTDGATEDAAASSEAAATGDDDVVKVQKITITEDGEVREHEASESRATVPELGDAAIEIAEATAVDVSELLPPEPNSDADDKQAETTKTAPLQAAQDEVVTGLPGDNAGPTVADAEDDGANEADVTPDAADDRDKIQDDDAESDPEIGGRDNTQTTAKANGVDHDADVLAATQTENRASTPRPPRRRARSYKIQEVIKRRQIVLVQVVKEERGNKGAALTTYLSLAGRYTVLMPNTARGGGISRKITNAQDRKRLKSVVQELDVPEGMGLIVRTAGAARTKQEIKRDFEYLLRLWETVRDLTLNSTAPALVYEEGNLIKRAIRDLYSKEIDEVVVSGAEAHRSAKDFMRMLMPSHAKNVVRHEEPISLFKRYGIETQLNALFNPIVTLPSGGYLVINQTEALVAIDINSGRSTREFSIEETAYKTNLEAAAEIARQLKLRDLAGLIVIDFIDMDEKRNNRGVERRLKECLKHDRARIQVGRISHFGLLEMSRQRLRTGMLEGSTTPCEHCQGTGTVRSVESVALSVLRAIEDSADAGGLDLLVTTPEAVAYYLLNNKRQFLADLEARCGIVIELVGSPEHQGTAFTVTAKDDGVTPLRNGRRSARTPMRSPVSVEQGFEAGAEPVESDIAAVAGETGDDEDGDGKRGRRRRRRRGGRRGDGETANEAISDEADTELAASTDGDDDGEPREAGDGSRSRRRGRRGGQRARRRSAGGPEGDMPDVAAPDAPQPDVLGDEAWPYVEQARTVASAAAAARRRMVGDRRSRSKGPRDPVDTPIETAAGDAAPMANGETAPVEANGADASGKTSEKSSPRRRNTRRRRREPETETAEARELADAASPADETAQQASAALDEANGSTPSYRNGNDTTPEAIEAGTAQVDATVEQGASEPAGEGEARPARQHWGEPATSQPILKRLIVGESETDEDADASGQDPKPQRKGWWQRNFG